MTELSLHILDIVQNSIRAKAGKIEVAISEDTDNDFFVIKIQDDGVGMDETQLQVVTDPFFTTRTTRKVGMGIALLKQCAEQTGGSLKLSSQKGYGTVLEAILRHQHVDRPILGDIAGTMTLLIGANPLIRFIYTHQTMLSSFELDTLEVLEELDDVPINDRDILKALKEMIDENLEMINACLK
jgi:hypothetical protein